MKKISMLLVICSLIMPHGVWAQVTENEIETGSEGRLSFELNKKIKKGVHLYLEGQARMTDDFSTIGRYDAGIGMSYKMNDWLKSSAGYTLINVKNSSEEWKKRHRIYADLTGTLKSGDWRFSLKESLQFTHRSGVNKYQTTPNALALKSRLKAEYKGFEKIDPYVYIEPRMALNDPSCSANWDGSAYSDYSFDGYTDTYMNRLRGAIGAEWKIDTSNSLEFCFMLDYSRDKEIDTNSEGTKLKSLAYDRTVTSLFTVGYVFSF